MLAIRTNTLSRSIITKAIKTARCASNNRTLTSKNAYTFRIPSNNIFQGVSTMSCSTLNVVSVVDTHKRHFSTDSKLDKIKEKDEIVLTAEIVRRIKADLTEADVNKDGRIDAEELKMVLRKHSDVFTEKDIVELGEMFYIAKSGEGIDHEKLLEGIAKLTKTKEELETESESGLSHRRTQIDRSHPLGLGNCGVEYLGANRPIYTKEELDVKITHMEPVTTKDKLAVTAVRVVRFCFDTVSLWKFGKITPDKVFRRVIFLETVAAVPGFVAAMVRHFKSIRDFSRDGGMLQMFLDEANNERMHLLTFVRMREPGFLMRSMVLASQCVTGVGFLILYHISPDFCHRFVGYIEEEAVHTYTDIIKCIENAPETDEMSKWRTELAPKIARGYWNLGEHGTVLDMMYAIRADEAEHRDVNHVCSGLKEGQMNPLWNPQDEFDKMLVKYVKDMMKKEK